MGKLVKLLGSGIGLASEALASRKSTNTTNDAASSYAEPQHEYNPYNGEPPPQYVELPEGHANQLIADGRAVPADEKHHGEAEQDEEHWALDEASHAANAYNEDYDDNAPAPTEEQMKNITASFLARHPPPRYPTRPLPLPVIIPQRRPRDKKRGFVNAYAPVLEGCDIDEWTFMEFLKTFHASCQASKSLRVVNVAAQGAGMVPSPIAMGVSIGVQVAVGVAMEVQRREKTNTFLDTLNDEFFKPRGLYALIMTYQPDDPRPARKINISGAINSTFSTPQKPGDKTYEDHVENSLSRPTGSGMAATMGKLRLSEGKTFGELELPESAPLIYPELDKMAAGTEGGKKESWMKSSGRFVEDYFDRRAQANFAAETGGSKLASQDPKFKSSLGDPNHKAYQGGLVNLLTGGNYDPRQRLMERRAGRRGEDPAESSRARILGRKQDGIVRRMIKKNVLYLLIVNLPSEQAMAEGREIVRREGVGQ